VLGRAVSDSSGAGKKNWSYLIPALSRKRVTKSGV